MASPELTLHVLPPSHPCLAVEAALRRKGLHNERVEPVHGSRPIMARLEQGRGPGGGVPRRVGTAADGLSRPRGG